ncbi:MAG: glycosyltransferase family 9 protein [Hydrotalea sp.]|nr:glycosyltransferase family 9 protein [Hydrotalea sp.]
MARDNNATSNPATFILNVPNIGGGGQSGTGNNAGNPMPNPGTNPMTNAGGNNANNPMLMKLQELVNQGMNAIQQKQWQVGLDALSQAALLSDQTPFLWEHLGLCAVQLEKYEAAYLHTTRLLWLQPDHVSAHLNRGRIANKLEMLTEAVADFEWVIAAKQSSPTQIAEAGVELIALYRDMATSKAEVKKALDIIAIMEKLPPEAMAPVQGKFYRHRIFTYLKAGDYKKGFEYYEVRNDPTIKLFSQPIWAMLAHHQDSNLWRGKESLKDKVILISAEQGFGDVIQFSRLLPDFLAMAKKQGAKKLLLEVYPTLVELMQSSPITKDIEVIARGVTTPVFDYWVRLGSLPHHLQLTIDTIPYAQKKPFAYLGVAPPASLTGEPAKTALSKPLLQVVPGRRKIGIAWSSNVSSNDNSLRSLPGLKTLLPLWDAEDCDFYSLQVGEKAKEIVELGMEAALLDLSPYLKNFADTARLVQEMDLVITIDSAVMHVAGALGKPAWVMAPYAADWRLGLGKAEDTHPCPWYPTATVVRCDAPGAWDKVIERLLEKLLNDKK